MPHPDGTGRGVRRGTRREDPRRTRGCQARYWSSIIGTQLVSSSAFVYALPLASGGSNMSVLLLGAEPQRTAFGFLVLIPKYSPLYTYTSGMLMTSILSGVLQSSSPRNETLLEVLRTLAWYW